MSQHKTHTHTHKLKGPAYCSLQVKMVYIRHLQQATPVQSPGSPALQENVSGCAWVDCDLRFSHNRRDRGFAVFQFRFGFCKFVICVYPRSTTSRVHANYNYKYLGALKNLFKRVRAFKIQLDFGSVGF